MTVSAKKSSPEPTPREIERRIRAGLAKALRTPAKPHKPSKAKGEESRAQ